jgi:hypothetical protein
MGTIFQKQKIGRHLVGQKSLKNTCPILASGHHRIMGATVRGPRDDGFKQGRSYRYSSTPGFRGQQLEWHDARRIGLQVESMVVVAEEEISIEDLAEHRTKLTPSPTFPDACHVRTRMGRGVRGSGLFRE